MGVIYLPLSKHPGGVLSLSSNMMYMYVVVNKLLSLSLSVPAIILILTASFPPVHYTISSDIYMLTAQSLQCNLVFYYISKVDFDRLRSICRS